MTTTHAVTRNSFTTSEPAIILQGCVNRSETKDRRAALNDRLNANADRVHRAAAANTHRLVGRDVV